MDDSKFYENVAAELAENDVKPGVWAKALAEALGDTDVAKGLYIRFRVEQLVREAQAVETAAKAQAAKAQRENGCVLAIILAVVGFFVLTYLGNRSNSSRNDVPTRTNPTPHQLTRPSNSDASLDETMSWIAQNFVASVGDDDFLRRQQKFEAEGCIVTMRVLEFEQERGRLGDRYLYTTKVDLSALHYPELEEVNKQKTPDGDQVSKLRFQAKGGQQIVYVATRMLEGGAAASTRRHEEFDRTGNVNALSDWKDATTSDSFTLHFKRAMAPRHQDAFTRAIELCGGGGKPPY